MQEVSHGNNFCWNGNIIIQITPELSFYDVLWLNSTNILMFGDNARSKSRSILCTKKRNWK